MKVFIASTSWGSLVTGGIYGVDGPGVDASASIMPVPVSLFITVLPPSTAVLPPAVTPKTPSLTVNSVFGVSF